MGSRGLIERVVGLINFLPQKGGDLSEGGGLFERGELNRGFKVFALFNSQARIITCCSSFFSSSSLGPSLAALLHLQALHFDLPAVILFTIP